MFVKIWQYWFWYLKVPVFYFLSEGVYTDHAIQAFKKDFWCFDKLLSLGL